VDWPVHCPAGWPWPIVAPSRLLTNVIEVGWKRSATVAPARTWLSDDGRMVSAELELGSGVEEGEGASGCGDAEGDREADGAAVVGAPLAARPVCPGPWSGWSAS
jgi:hypothetical protein